MNKLENMPGVDLDMLTMALQAGDLDIGWWLDTENGEVIPKPDPAGGAEEQAILKAGQKQPDRYIDIEPLSVSMVVELMESFVATLDDEKFCVQLQEALAREQAVWHFKGALATNPEHEETWYAFKEQFYALQARQWLRDMGYEYEEKVASEISDDFNATLGQVAEQIMLELVVSYPAGRRRYVVWQASEPDTGLTLTVYQGANKTTDQVIGETAIDNSQLDGINHVLDQLSVRIGQAPGGAVTDQSQARLSIYASEHQSEVIGPLKPGSIHDQIQTLFNFLLSLTPPGRE